MQTQVVLDSNIWIAEHMLRQGSGSAFRLYLKRQDARLVLPEIVYLEVRSHLEAEINRLISEIQQSHRELLVYAETLKELVLPTAQEVAGFVDSAFAGVGIEMHHVPFSLESARSALEKCLRHEPPSGKNNEQFRDGVIWADCLRLAQDSPVIFVTGDAAFYRDRKLSNDPASNLKIEAAATRHGIRWCNVVSVN